jgi:hypothetical protein
VTDLRRLAEAVEWALNGNPWEYATDANPESIYAQWVAACSPEVILALLDVVDAARDGSVRHHPNDYDKKCPLCDALARLDEVTK